MTGPETQSSPAPMAETALGRFAVIDIVRGLAILWVMTFHLWIDMTGGFKGVSPLYERLGDRVTEGNPLNVLTAAGELVLGSGYQGVAVFMMLSGLSLTLNAQQRAKTPTLPAWAARFRKVIVAYWGGVLFVFGVFALIALLQVWTDGGSYGDQWKNVHIGVTSRIRFELLDLPWAFSVFGPLVRDKFTTAPIGSLWFVPLLLQYYLLFPLLLPLLRRIGPWNFAIASFAATIVARALFYQYAPDIIEARYLPRTMDMVSVFHLTEFMFGMSLGYLLAERRAQITEWVSSPFDIAGLIAFGLVMQWASVSIESSSVLVTATFIPIQHAALALFITPLIFKVPGRLELSSPARALAALGVISMAALIVNDAMRFVASFLREQDLPSAIWWFFLVVLYIPGASVVLAYPMAKLLGLVPAQRRAARAEPPPGAVADIGMQPAPGG